MIDLLLVLILKKLGNSVLRPWLWDLSVDSLNINRSI